MKSYPTFKVAESIFSRLQTTVRGLYKKYSIPRAIVFATDNIAVFVVFLFACLLRYNFVMADFSLKLALYQAILTLVVYAISSLILRSYAGLLRHTTIIDVLNVFLATSYSFIVLLFISIVSRQIPRAEFMVIPISILIIHYVSITVLLIFVRISIKILYHLVTSSFIEKKNVLIFGAGEMGAVVKRVIHSDENGIYQVFGFLDENKKLQGKKLNGLTVYNPAVLDFDFIQRNRIFGIIYAIRHISSGKKSMLLGEALEMGLEVLEPPSVDTWVNGQFQIQQIQKVKLEDLLGRNPIRLNMKKIGGELAGKTMLVTGAAGSIGSELVRQLARFKIGNLILIDQAETPMFNLENELRRCYSHFPVKLILADVTNQTRMEQIFMNYKPEIVFHAAAYKHVPVLEENPHEAIRVNVGGTRIMTNLAIKYGVRKFVMISTDKAVNPTNVMGASKRMCEIIVQHKARNAGNAGQFIVTRFGNVLGSNGSVIPIFRKQIEEGGPVTVTHPQMTRYFMTIPEACQLVLEAGFMGKGGEIFVFDMGKPVKIADIAGQMIRLSGLVPDRDIKIVYTGLRPGEKLYEELFTERENTKETHHVKIRIASVEEPRNDDVLSRIEDLLNNLYTLTGQQVVDSCRDIVPEYKTTNSLYLENGDHQEHPVSAYSFTPPPDSYRDPKGGWLITEY